MTELRYTVPDMSCDHCKVAVSSELKRVSGVAEVDVNLETKRVVVRGNDLDDARLRAAIVDAGYQAT